MRMIASRSDVVRGLRRLALDAGEEILVVYRAADHGADQKPDGSPITIADRVASDVIVGGLAATLPGVDVVCEETENAPNVGGRFVLVDPLDGTKEFIGRNGEFTVNIALVEDGQAVAGVVYAPALGLLYLGWQDGARGYAYEETNGGTPRPLEVRKPTEELVAVVSRSHADQATTAYLKELRVKSSVATGSSLKFCMVARGEADVYPRLGRTMEWDTAAGHAVLEAAGGSVSTLDGKALLYGKPGFENPHFVARGRVS
jgi:3'(2'), 5'-bisphosphate nucleotidase